MLSTVRLFAASRVTFGNPKVVRKLLPRYLSTEFVRCCESYVNPMAAKNKVKAVPTSSLVNCYLQVLGTGGGELMPSLFLFTDTKRYLFNCGENLQRSCIEHKIKLTKLQNMFFTRVSWDNLGGLAGLSLFLRSENRGSEINLYGPEDLTNYAAALGVFLGHEKVLLNTPTDDADSVHEYKDENVTIRTIQIQAAKPYESDSASDSETTQVSQPQAKRTATPDNVAAFICKLVDIPGKVDAQKAKELGVLRGPTMKKLISGESVTTPEGKVIHLSEIIGPERKGPTFVVLECPHLGFIPSVTTHPLLQCDAFTDTEQSVILIAHIAPKEVLQSEAYCRWMASFGPDTKHLLLGKSLCPNEVNMRSMLKMQCPLHLMSPSIHPLPAMEETNTETGEDLPVYQMLPRESIITGQIKLKYILKPSHKAGVDNSGILRPVKEVVEEQISEIGSNLQLAAAVKHPDQVVTHKQPSFEKKEGSQQFDIAEEAKPSSKLILPSAPMSSPLSPDDAVITFLGTGSACPSKYRNVSGILLQIPSGGNLLLDCGEGTLSQIYKCFGQQGGDDVIRNLKAVFISHIHGDHHLGVISVLQRRHALLRSGGNNRIIVVGPPLLNRWLTVYRIGCESVLYKFVDCAEVLDGSYVLADCSIQTVPVIHCKWAYGVILTHRTKWKIVYSGDTRPCQELAEAGQDATLLIHEATFEDDLWDDAIAKKHCTVSEALEIAKQMNPEFTVLTHFSQRYPKVPPALFNNGTITSRVALAFDCMRFRLSEVHILPSYLPAIKEIFAVVMADDVNEPGSSWSW